MQKIRRGDKFAAFSIPWSPRTIVALNDQHFKVAKFLGEFVWHAHEDADELLLVIRGRLDLEFRERTVHLGPGELLGLDGCRNGLDISMRERPTAILSFPIRQPGRAPKQSHNYLHNIPLLRGEGPT